MIRLEQVTKRYGRFTAVDALDLEVGAGEIVGLLGPNGAGKTTTLRMIAGILRPDGGRILIGGHDLVHEPGAARARLGFVPDRPFVYEKLTGTELLRFVAGLHGHEGPGMESRIDELMELWELGPWKDKLVESYSHGMRQKVILSTAFVHRPDVLVIDEPMVGLDPRSARLLRDLVASFAAHGGAALISTHTLELAEMLCHRLAVIDHGRVVAEGTMAALREQADTDEGGLEEVFLRITRGATDWEIDRVVAR